MLDWNLEEAVSKKTFLGCPRWHLTCLSEVALYWEQVLRMNDFQCQRLLQRILSLFGDSLLGVKVAFLGFSYKSGTGDEKGNLAKHLIQKLLTYGAEVSIHDPLVSRHDIFSELALDRPPLATNSKETR
jgi:UDPglucose 6-dehydrogenase